MDFFWFLSLVAKTARPFNADHGQPEITSGQTDDYTVLLKHFETFLRKTFGFALGQLL